jgi:high mobility group protein B1
VQRVDVGEVGKALGEMWKAMSDADKAPFEQLAAQDKARYQREMEEFKRNGVQPQEVPIKNEFKSTEFVDDDDF